MELPKQRVSTHNPNVTDDILQYSRRRQDDSMPQVHVKHKPKAIEAKAKFLSTLLYSVCLLALGGVITGITYSMADPGGTYTVTTGLFVIGGIYFCIAIWNLMKWMTYSASGK